MIEEIIKSREAEEDILRHIRANTKDIGQEWYTATAKEIAAKLSRPYNQIRWAIAKLCKKGLIIAEQRDLCNMLARASYKLP